MGIHVCILVQSNLMPYWYSKITFLLLQCLEKDDTKQWHRSIKVSSMGLPDQRTVHPYFQGKYV